MAPSPFEILQSLVTSNYEVRQAFFDHMVSRDYNHLLEATSSTLSVVEYDRHVLGLDTTEDRQRWGLISTSPIDSIPGSAWASPSSSIPYSPELSPASLFGLLSPSPAILYDNLHSHSLDFSASSAFNYFKARFIDKTSPDLKLNGPDSADKLDDFISAMDKAAKTLARNPAKVADSFRRQWKLSRAYGCNNLSHWLLQNEATIWFSVNHEESRMAGVSLHKRALSGSLHLAYHENTLSSVHWN
jgi:hypothetical protein